MGGPPAKLLVLRDQNLDVGERLLKGSTGAIAGILVVAGGREAERLVIVGEPPLDDD
jgi:hypothetical protein